MSTKSFLFIGSWMQPLKALPLQERWNVIEAIVEYSTSGTLSMSLDVMESIAFGFIRNEIDRMKQHRTEVCERRRAAANTRWEKVQSKSKLPDAILASNELPDTNACDELQSDATVSNELPDANACKEIQSDETVSNELPDANACIEMQSDAPYHIESLSESVSKSVSGSESKSENKSSSTSSGVRVRGDAGKEIFYDDSQLLPRFFNMSNQAKTESLEVKIGRERESYLQTMSDGGGLEREAFET